MRHTPEDVLAAKGSSIDVAVRGFVDAVRRTYGDRLKGVYLFGSRARGDHRSESDVDIAIVLGDGAWKPWDEKMRIAELEYDTIVATGVEPQGWPIRQSEWFDPKRHRNPDLVRAMQRDAHDLLAGR